MAFFNLPLLREFRDRFQDNENAVEVLQRQMRNAAAEIAVSRWPDRLNELLKLLKPRKVIGREKVRLGARADGGYVLLDDLSAVPLAYSLGIEKEVTWDLEIVRRGVPVRQYDFSIKCEPVAHPLIKFFRLRVEDIKDLQMPETKGQLLKIDIEGSEWSFFDSASTVELERFDQIVGEFHDFDLYHDSEWWARTLRVLKKLETTHQLIHVHGNNCYKECIFWTGKMDLPFCLELTYVLRSKYKFEETTEPLPGPYDYPNYADKKDFDLNALTRN